MTLLQHKRQTSEQARDLNKAARLVWLFLHPGGNKQKATDYKATFPLARSTIHVDLSYDFPALVKRLAKDFPALGSLLRQQVTPEDLRALPMTTVDRGALSHLSVDLIINHETNTITWFPFKQQVYDKDGHLIASVEYPEGTDSR